MILAPAAKKTARPPNQWTGLSHTGFSVLFPQIHMRVTIVAMIASI
jgi:hypothetical protein